MYLENSSLPREKTAKENWRDNKDNFNQIIHRKLSEDSYDDGLNNNSSRIKQSRPISESVDSYQSALEMDVTILDGAYGGINDR